MGGVFVTVLGATDLRTTIQKADVAPIAKEVISVILKAVVISKIKNNDSQKKHLKI